jgi:hypothetical protein
VGVGDKGPRTSSPVAVASLVLVIVVFVVVVLVVRSGESLGAPFGREGRFVSNSGRR